MRKRKIQPKNAAKTSPVKGEESKVPQLITKRPKDRSGLLLASGIAFLVIGFAFGYFYSTTYNQLLAFPAIICWGIGGLQIYLYRRRREESTGEIVAIKKPIATQQVNSMNIYPIEEGGVVFEDMANPEGQPRLCLNDGRPYFVHMWDEKRKRLVPFILPDQQYFEPREFAERVLSLPAHRRLFTRRQGLLQKISPFVLIIVIVILWILIVTTTAPEGA